MRVYSLKKLIIAFMGSFGVYVAIEEVRFLLIGLKEALSRNLPLIIVGDSSYAIACASSFSPSPWKLPNIGSSGLCRYNEAEVVPLLLGVRSYSSH